MLNGWQERFEMIWEKGEYRQGSCAQRLAGMFLACVPEGAIINDYGSGTGRAELAILKVRPNQRINMIDLAKTALEFDVNDYPTLTFTLADLSDIGEMEIADWGYCIGVLMLVQPDKLNDILAEIRRTCRNLFMEVYDVPDVRCGIDLTTIPMNGGQWKAKLAEFWPDVELVPSPEAHYRYILVCRSGK